MKRLLAAAVFIFISATAASAGGAVIVLMRTAGQGERGGDIIRAAAESRSADVVRVYDSLSAAGTIGVIQSGSVSSEELIKSLKDDPDVVSVMEDRTVRALRTPSASEWSKQWNMPAVSAPEAWDHTVGSRTISVAVVDSGVDSDHPDLAPNMDGTRGKAVAGKTTNDANGHGTHVAGIIGATGTGKVAGLNWDVNIIPIRTLDERGYGSVSNLIDALDYLAELINTDRALKLAAVNLSLGFYDDAAPAEMLRSPFGTALKVFSELERAPIVTVAASNEGVENGVPLLEDIYETDGTLIGGAGMYSYPASLSITDIKNLIVVGAVDNSGASTAYSNWGSTAVHIVAPGSRIRSTVIPDGATGEKSGTSMAAPHVAGAAALIAAKLESEGKTWDAAVLKSRILSTADRRNIPQIRSANEPRLSIDRSASMNGMLNVYAAAVSTDQEIAEAGGVAPTALDVKLASPYGSSALVGAKYQLVSQLTPPYAAAQVEWESSDPAVATVDVTGVLTAVSVGTVKVTCTDRSGLAKSLYVTVIPARPDVPQSSGGGGGGCAAGASVALLALIAAIKIKRTAR